MRAPATDGVLLVDKPAGVTSHDVVAATRRVLGERRVGHGGTLDPFATGLLVLLVGRATRLLPYLDGEPKVYDATIEFGRETATDDATGPTVREAALPDRAGVERAMRALTGVIDQVPPDYSAKQVGGRRAYSAARAGTPLPLAPVRVAVHSWIVREWRESGMDVTIACGGGTYVRALARDLGRLANSAAHLATLRRTRSGTFDVDQALALDAMGEARARLRPSLDAIPALAVAPLDADALRRVLHGRSVPAAGMGDRVALVDREGALVAVAERCGEEWQPRVVIRDA